MSNVKKKKIRQGHRAYLRKILGNAKDIISDYNETVENKLKQLRISLQERLDTLKSLDEEILEELEEEEEIIGEIEEAGKYRESVHEVIVNIEGILKKQQSINTAQLNTSSESTSTSQSKPKPETRLPKLVLKSFAGEPSEWPAGM